MITAADLFSPQPETLWAVYAPTGERYSMLCETAEAAIDDTLGQVYGNTWEMMQKSGYTLLPVHVRPAA